MARHDLRWLRFEHRREKFHVPLALIALLSAHTSGCGDETTRGGTLQVLMLADLTGPTSFVGRSYHAGRIDHIRQINDDGGIRGYFIRVEEADTAYDADEALFQYLTWKANVAWPHTVTLFGYGTDSTLALASRATVAGMPFLAKGCTGSLAPPSAVQRNAILPDGTEVVVARQAAPTVFSVCLDYASSVKAGLQFIRQQGGRHIAFAYCPDTTPCTSQARTGKAYAEGMFGIALDDDIVVGLQDSATDVRRKMLDYMASHTDIDWIWLATPHQTSSYVVRGAPEQNIKFMGNIWSFGDAFDSDTGGLARGRVFGFLGGAPFGATLGSPVMDDVMTVFERYRASTEDQTLANVYYVMGYATVAVWEIAVERLLVAGREVTREAIATMLNSFVDIRTGGLLPPLSFTTAEHRPVDTAAIYSLDADGSLKYETNLHVVLDDELLGL